MTQISSGFTDTERSYIATLYWQAFGAKLGKVMGPERLALKFIARNINPEFALIARGENGAVMGIAGFKTSQGAFLGGDLRELAEVYGWLSTCWRAPLLSLVERDLEDGILLMDGICVSPDSRGKGIGTALLHAIKWKAEKLDCTSVRLDVIDRNPKARALYEREGFRAKDIQHLGPFARIFGFSSSTRMLWSATA